jgi:hypothetical protein
VHLLWPGSECQALLLEGLHELTLTLKTQVMQKTHHFLKFVPVIHVVYFRCRAPACFLHVH